MKKKISEKKCIKSVIEIVDETDEAFGEASMDDPSSTRTENRHQSYVHTSRGLEGSMIPLYDQVTEDEEEVSNDDGLTPNDGDEERYFLQYACLKRRKIGCVNCGENL